MRLLVLRGSPYRGGNSDTLADEFIEGAAFKRIIDVAVSDMNISPCLSCRVCEKKGHCVIDDDAVGFYERLKSADVLVVATCIHFGGLPSRFVSLVERAQPLWAATHIFKTPPDEASDGSLRRGYILLTGGSKKRIVGRPAIAILRNWLATLGFTPTALLYASGYDAHNQIAGDERVLKKARLLGQSLIHP